MRKLRIQLAQIEVTPRKPWINLQRAKDAIVESAAEHPDLIVFSEMFLPGYLIGDHWERPDFLKDCDAALNDLREFSRGFPESTIIIGTVRTDNGYCNEDGRIRKYNRAIIIENGRFVLEVTKTLQPNYREFDDDRHFYSNRKDSADRGDNPPVWENSIFVKSLKDKATGRTREQIKIGVILCEDGWDDDYTIHPVSGLFAAGAEMIVNVSCSPYTFGKNDKRNRVFGSQAADHKLPIVYVNNVGVQNNGKNVFAFDGNSCIYDTKGGQLNPYMPFEEGTRTFEIDLDKEFDKESVEREDDETLWRALVYGTKKFCNRMGIKRVVIGASGGVDSAVSACLFVKILGKENVTLVNMPSRYNSDLTKNAAKQLAENLGTEYIVVPIEDSVSLTARQMDSVGITLTEFMLQNVQARDRSSRILAAVAAGRNAVFTCNANKSEAMVGYTTLYGDLGGFFAPLGDLWKTQVYEIANYINRSWDGNQPFVGYPIPNETIQVVPSAELGYGQDVTKGLGDPIKYNYHDKLFASWIERWNRATPETCLDWYLNGTLAKEIGYDEEKFLPISRLFKNATEFIADLEKWWNLYDGFAIAKRIQAPPILSLSRRSLGYDHRETQEPPYYSKRYLDLKKRIVGETI